MGEHINILDDSARLILHRTPREDIKKGITIMYKGEGVRLVDKVGNGYLDMEAGITRPVHVGYGRQEVAQAAYDQMCKLHYVTPCGFANEPAMNLADLLAEITPEAIPPLPPENKRERLRREFAVLGFLCDRHPMELYAATVQRLKTVKAVNLPRHIGRRVRFAGWLITGKVVTTKYGDPMEFLTFEDGLMALGRTMLIY